jgi:hypothetical protein
MFLVQLGFAVHAVRTGRDAIWIYIIVFIPGIGCLLYLVTQVLPELSQGQAVSKARGTIVKSVDQRRELRNRMDDLAVSDTLQNKMTLADECLEAAIYDEAISLYQSCLTGTYEHDPELMAKLARAQFLDGAASAARATLDALIKANPNYQSTEDHLLYARCLEALALYADASKEYDALVRAYPGEEARVRYALMLKGQGELDRAEILFIESLARSRRAPNYYWKKEKEWLKIAQGEVSG